MTLLVRNASDKEIPFTADRYHLNPGESIVYDANGNRKKTGGLADISGNPETRHYDLQAGMIAVFQQAPISFVSEDTFEDTIHPVTDIAARPGPHTVQIKFEVGSLLQNTDNFMPRPSDWTGMLTTGKVDVNVVEKATDEASSTRLQFRWEAPEGEHDEARALPWFEGCKPTPESPDLWVEHYAFVTGDHVVLLTLTEDGAARFFDMTKAGIGRKLAIVIDNQVVSAPVVQSPIRNAIMIAGNFDEATAEKITVAIESSHPDLVAPPG